MKTKTSTIIWYIVIAAVIYYLIYKAYTNYQISGSIFSSEIPGLLNGGTSESASRFGISSAFLNSIRGGSSRGFVSARDCLKKPGYTWTTNGGCYPPAKASGGASY